jgi:hypothetical protein
MTRVFRAIRFRCLRTVYLSAAAMGALLSLHGAALATDDPPALRSMDLSTDDNAPADSVVGQPAPSDVPAPVADTAPRVETTMHHFYCVEYARLRSGLEIFGDAKLWWARAKDIYQEFTAPVADAVMVFAGSNRIRRGHVAVVTAVLSPREIRVDQANWQNHGEIDRNTPVLDVSSGNDWSKVRVWDVATGQFGAHIYAIKGFISRAMPAVAATGS